MKDIYVLTAFTNIKPFLFRTEEDLSRYDDSNFKIKLSSTKTGVPFGQSYSEYNASLASMPLECKAIQEFGATAIVIESMGDNALDACREYVDIPVIGLSDCCMRVASSLGRKFGCITAGKWHGNFLTDLSKQYDCYQSFGGFYAIESEPFFMDDNSKQRVLDKILTGCKSLIDQNNVDVVLLSGSYFLGMNSILEQSLQEIYGAHIPVIDPLSTGIQYAKFLVSSSLSYSKINQQNRELTNVVGYRDFDKI